jgi:diguanylate cyclase (GGDEF)-like protein/PAS domain S-box-containing protein
MPAEQLTLHDIRRSLETVSDLALLRDAVESLTYGLCLYDAGNRLVAANSSYHSTYGLPQGALRAGMRLEEIAAILQDSGALADPGNARLVASMLTDVTPGAPRSVVRNLADGRIISVTFNRLASGGWLALHMDVTAQANAQRALEDNRQRFEDFAESASDWCWETDAEHRYVDPDLFMGREARFGSKDYVGQRRIDLPLAPEDRPVLEAHMLDLEARRPFKDMLYRVPNTDGSIAWIKASGKPIYDRSGAFRGYRGSARDVTLEMQERHTLAREQAALKRAEEVAGVGHWRWDKQTNQREWSASVFDIFGFGRDQGSPSLKKIIEKIHPDDRAAFSAYFFELGEGKVGPARDYRFQRAPEGDIRWCRLRVDIEHDRHGDFSGLFGIVRDVTDEVRAAQEISDRTQRLVEAQAIGKIGDWSYRLGDVDLYWSREVYSLLRYDPATFPSTRDAVMGVYHGDGAERVLQAQAEVMRTRQTRTVDVKGRRGDSTIGDFAVTSKVIEGPDGRVTGFSGTIQDISERKQAQEQLEKLAYYDQLTGLANRALFRREVEQMLQNMQLSAGSGALLLLDLDRFKEVNDALGHAAGDELLAKAAHLLSKVVGPDCFMSRLGGDEFAVVLRRCDDEERALDLGRAIILALAKPIHLSRGEVQVGVSVGVVMAPRDGADGETLLRHADLALYRAKEDGRGRVCMFNKDMSELAQQKTAMARDLRQAAFSGTGLETRFQPQVDLASGRVVGFEALMRWNHPARGYVPPTEFIPIAESSSLISELGLWIMLESAKLGRQWLDAGEPAREISVNVSAAQIWQTDFEADVAMVLQDTGLPPHLLCLELTESLFADHSEARVRQSLAALKELGVTLALDDFGTGFSSLGYLTQLPFDKLKIDRVFVDGVVQSTRKRKLLEGMIALGRGLGMTVVAEGAELAEEVEILRGFGCAQVQGYVFAKPALPHEALAFAQRSERGFAADPARMAAALRGITAQAG